MKSTPAQLAIDAAIIAPPVRLKVSEWADRYAYLPSEGNAEPGKYRLSRMPHQAEMLDDPIDPEVREFIWMLASQAGGKTLCLILVCEYVIKVLRRSLIMCRATKETATEWMRDKFLPTVEATPCMEGLLLDPRKRGSNSTSLNRKFPGGGLKAIGAKSPAAFRGASAGVALGDETDSWEDGKEGDSELLLDRATITFGAQAIKGKSSTPTRVETSRIYRGYLRGDQRKYFLPCHHCGEFQDLKESQLKFSFTAEEYARFGIYETQDDKTVQQNPRHEGQPVGHRAPDNETDGAAISRQKLPGVSNQHAENASATWEIGDFPIRDTARALYVCEHCHHGWTDTQRIAAYMSGHVDNPPVIVAGNELRAHWRATAPFKGIRSRHLNGMYLTIGLERGYANYLQQFAEKFLEAKSKGPGALMAHTNMFSAWPYEDPHEKIKWKDIRDRAEDYCPEKKIPAQAVWINWSMDVQQDRVEILFVGWGDKNEAFALEYHVEYGDFDTEGMQQRVWAYLESKRFKHPVLGDLMWSSGLVDSGYQTKKVKAVYKFCAAHWLMNVWACKGTDELAGSIYTMKNERRFGGKIVRLATNILKDMIFDRLNNADHGENTLHFPKENVTHDGEKLRTRFNDKFFMGVCSEKKVRKKLKNGGHAMVWEKITSSTRNEPLDMLVYAFGNFEVMRQENYIARTWAEVKKKLEAMHKPLPASPGVVTANPESESKLPELRAASQPRPPRKKIRINSPFGNRFGRFGQ